MGTTTIEARRNARPTSLAFILPGPDRDLLQSVISRATTFWGGIFNPDKRSATDEITTEF